MSKTENQMEEKIEAAVKADGQPEVHVIYSAYESDERDNPIDNLNEIAFDGEGILVGFRDEFWGGKASQDYISPVLNDPTWLEVCVHANKMIELTRDHHHCFLEGLTMKKQRTKEGILRYEFCMGS